MSKTRASCFITGSKYLETDESTRPLSSVSQYLEPVIKHSPSFLAYYVQYRSLVNVPRSHSRLLATVFFFRLLHSRASTFCRPILVLKICLKEISGIASA